MVQSFLNPSELLPGYATIERVGGGGYGEVWKVKAPGGLDKAIKVIYGYVNEERASRELKALNRVKQIRHPFLLSLERIEVVANQLLVVTELADRSLIERFEECLESGLKGIPRDELIGYLQDAASALDYMLEKKSLQHLDIKPENLLILSDRIKVADFGLVKDLADQGSTLMGGLTPVYASPEVFSGKASRQSDQYSLSIVFQHMLTGVLPFPGRTQQQLSIQHRQASPRLAALPAADREAVARALSKEPTNRFPSCKAFVDALVNGPQTSVPVPNRPEIEQDAAGQREQDTKSQNRAETTFAPDRAVDPEAIRTESLDSIPKRRRTMARSVTLDAIAVSADVRDLEPIEIEDYVPDVRPTLYIGLGGTGSRVLQSLKSLVNRWEGSASDATQLLLLDTDADTIKEAREGAFGASLDRDEALCLNLRRPREYQERSDQLMRWISRRWLYNIPRSLKPQGYRPLGRLAWVDHAERVYVSLRSRLKQLVAEQSIHALEEATGLPCRNRSPRVFLVGSTAGGTGGGMMLDAIQTVRVLLRELDLSDDGICVCLMYSTNGNPRESTLASANTYSLLSELQHMAKPSQASEAAESQTATTSGLLWPLPDTYFVNLGEQLSEEGYDERIAEVADYLYCNAATPAGAVLDQCRSSSSKDAGEDLMLRSFGVSALQTTAQDGPAQWAKLLCQHVVQRWLGFGERRKVDPRVECELENEFGDWVKNCFVESLSQYLRDYRPLPTEAPADPEQDPMAELMPVITRAASQLRYLVTQLEVSEAASLVLAPASSSAHRQRTLDQRLEQAIPRLAEDLAVHLLPEFFKSEAFLNQLDVDAAQPLAAMLQAAAQARIVDEIQNLDTGHTIDERGFLSPTQEKLEACFDAAVLRLPGCGFARRCFIVDRQDSRLLERPMPQNAMMLSGPIERTIIFQEAEGISLAQLAYLLTECRPDVADAAIRLHTRNDVRWTYPPPIRTSEHSHEAAWV